jgi:hypothetical protein
MKKLCGECGKREVERRAVEGRRSPWHQFTSLPVPADLEIPTCSNCGSEWINREVAEKLDAALAKAAAARRLQLVQESLAELRPRLQQQELERLLGLSGGYVSKVKHGKEDPSDYLVVAMLLLASRPEAVEQVKRSWDTGHLPLRLTNNHFSRVAVPVTGDLPVAA